MESLKKQGEKIYPLRQKRGGGGTTSEMLWKKGKHDSSRATTGSKKGSQKKKTKGQVAKGGTVKQIAPKRGPRTERRVRTGPATEQPGEDLLGCGTEKTPTHGRETSLNYLKLRPHSQFEIQGMERSKVFLSKKKPPGKRDENLSVRGTKF